MSVTLPEAKDILKDVQVSRNAGSLAFWQLEVLGFRN